MGITLDFSSENQTVEAVLSRLQEALADCGPLSDLPDQEILDLIDVHIGKHARLSAGELRFDGAEAFILWLDLPEDWVGPGH